MTERDEYGMIRDGDYVWIAGEWMHNDVAYPDLHDDHQPVDYEWDYTSHDLGWYDDPVREDEYCNADFDRY